MAIETRDTPIVDRIGVRRALLSVYDKTGLVPLAEALADRGVSLVSTGGTARSLRDAGLIVWDVADVTGFPEIMDGRVKTLHPAIHGGLLAVRGEAGHEAAMETHGIAPFELLVCNLYPFEQVVAEGGSYAACVENIDIGGPAMLRAAAKNHASVSVLTDPAQYDAFAETLDGRVPYAMRQRLAQAAYAHTAAYDAAVSNWMAGAMEIESPPQRAFAGRLAQTMRYGENPHQAAALYLDGSARPGAATAEQVQGKALSYNNVADTDAAFELAAEFEAPTIVIVKHANPCGVATADTLAEAHALALRCDPVSAFGGIVAANRPLDRAAAEAIVAVFTEVVIAPGADEAAREVFAAKPNLRLLVTGTMPDPRAGGSVMKPVAGGMLVQDRDAVHADDLELRTVTKRAPTESEMADLRFAFTVAKHVKSNAIVYARDGATVGVGAGQMSRVDSSRIAARKAAEAGGDGPSLAEGAVVASDAFFPFADGLLAAAEAGATAVIQQGGSKRDEEVIAAADEAGLAMVFAGVRHFRH